MCGEDAVYKLGGKEFQMMDEAMLKLQDLNAERTYRLLYGETSLTKLIVGKRGLHISLLGTDNKVTLSKCLMQNNDFCKREAVWTTRAH